MSGRIKGEKGECQLKGSKTFPSASWITQTEASQSCSHCGHAFPTKMGYALKPWAQTNPLSGCNEKSDQQSKGNILSSVSIKD